MQGLRETWPANECPGLLSKGGERERERKGGRERERGRVSKKYYTYYYFYRDWKSSRMTPPFSRALQESMRYNNIHFWSKKKSNTLTDLIHCWLSISPGSGWFGHSCYSLQRCTQVRLHMCGGHCLHCHSPLLQRPTWTSTPLLQVHKFWTNSYDIL